MKKSPMQRVKEEFGSKDELASKVLPLLEKPEDETDEEFERRIRTCSNRKLLRMWETEQRVKDEFGSKEKLADAIVGLKFGGKSNDDYRSKLLTYANTRLLDLHGTLSRKA